MSSETAILVRHRVVEQFREGEVRVLVNYGTFREGFDAPKTKAIVVTRPVYSPNLYFQMIGRGLRGVMNGGNDRCLILNVRDNIENFERRLASAEFDWLRGAISLRGNNSGSREHARTYQTGLCYTAQPRSRRSATLDRLVEGFA